LIKRLYKAHNIDEERFPPRQLQYFIADAKEEGLRPNQVEAGDDVARRQVEHYALYDAMCQREGVVDFAELLLRSYELLARHDGLREHYRRRFEHLLVDEFQDTNILQYRWLKQLTGERTAVFAVGDDDQSIYAFRGANVANMQHFERDFSRDGNPVALVKLEQNYRSHGNILDAANALIKNNQGRLGKNLWTSDDKGEPVRALSAPSDLDEAAFIVDAAKSLSAEGVVLSEIAVLYRSNAQSRVLEHALFNAAIPYRVYGGMRFFERAEIKNALAYLRLVSAPEDDGAFLRIVNFPPRGIGARTLETLVDAARREGTTLWQLACSGGAVSGRSNASLGAFVRLIESMRAATAGLPLPEAVQHVNAASGLLTHYRNEKDGQDRVDNLDELVNAAQSFLREADLAVDAPVNTPGIDALEAAESGATDPLTGLSRARRTRGGRHASGGGPPRVAAHDGSLREGTRVPHGFRHRSRRGSLPAREQPRRARWHGGRAQAHVRRHHARQAASLSGVRAKPDAARAGSLQHPSRFLDELPRELVHWLSPPRRRRFDIDPAEWGERPAAATPARAPSMDARSHSEPGHGWRIGQSVRHAKFGLGIIIDAEGRGGDSRVQVNFRDAGVKWLALEYAKLEAA
jgi:DNA helicase-2/ATP-dependent DNA helicase PcrA